MKLYVYALIFGLFFLVISCKKGFTSTDLESHFSAQQIAEFSTLVNFFSNEICEDKKTQDFKVCFKLRLPLLLESTNNPILKFIDFEKQKELYSGLSKNTFDAIWLYKQRTTGNPNLSYRMLTLNQEGLYFKFLKDLGKNNKLVATYVEAIRYAGGIESYGILESDILRKVEGLDFDDPDIQLLITVHYLIANDHRKRNEIWPQE